MSTSEKKEKPKKPHYVDNKQFLAAMLDWKGLVSEAEEEGEVETDPYAGTNVDASQLGQLQEEALSGNKSKPQENPPATRNKPSMNVGPDKRFSGLPKDAGNENVDKRTERRVG